MSKSKILENLDKAQGVFYKNVISSGMYHPAAEKIIEMYLAEIVEKGVFCIRVRAKALLDIIKSNEIKSSMQSGAGTGATIGGKDIRRAVTQMLFHCDTDKFRPEDYPKYGYLTVPNLKYDMVYNADMGYQYGFVIIRLKKENVFNRATMTVGNTVNFQACSTKIPSFVTNPKMTCVRCAEAGLDGQPCGFDRAAGYYLDFARKINSGELTPENFAQLANIYDGASGFEFFELQFHGVLKLDTDVERIDALTMEDGDLQIFENAKILLDKMKIPFEYRESIF